MRLKKIFILRHSQPDPRTENKLLTTTGYEQARNLGLKLKREHGLDPANTKVVCSEEPRTIKTAQKLGLGDEEWHSAFFSDVDSCNVEEALRIIEQHILEGAKNIVLVTHFEMAGELPVAFLRKHLGIGDASMRAIDYGQGYVIDCEQGTCQFVRA